MNFIFSLLFITSLFTQEINCLAENSTINRSIYSIGDTLSIDDQNILFPYVMELMAILLVIFFLFLI